MPSFPTAKGKTERNARNTCVRSVRSSIAGKACLKIIKNFDIQLYIDQCVTDVRVSIITENENMLKIIKFEFSYVQRGWIIAAVTFLVFGHITVFAISLMFVFVFCLQTARSRQITLTQCPWYLFKWLNIMFIVGSHLTSQPHQHRPSFQRDWKRL